MLSAETSRVAESDTRHPFELVTWGAVGDESLLGMDTKLSRAGANPRGDSRSYSGSPGTEAFSEATAWYRSKMTTLAPCRLEDVRRGEVAYPNGVQGVPGSNPGVPTTLSPLVSIAYTHPRALGKTPETGGLYKTCTTSAARGWLAGRSWSDGPCAASPNTRIPGTGCPPRCGRVGPRRPLSISEPS